MLETYSRLVPTRRDLLTATATSALAGSTLQTTQAQTRPAADSELPDAEIDAAGRIVGREYADDEKELMRRGLLRTRAVLTQLRKQDIPPSVEPAVIFDPIPPGATLPTGESSFSADAAVPEYDGDVASLAFATVPQLSALLRAGRVSSVDLTRMYLARLKEHGPTLNCVITLTEDLAMEQAERADAERKAGNVRGPLHGVPYGVKDLLATKGIPTTYGVSPYRDQIFDFDATVVKRLEEAGAVLLAKLSLGELAMDDVWFGGQTKNPWNLEQGSSGSSAGSASATAAGLVGFSIGSETLGSIVSPCVRCGTCGLRPTYGRVPRTGAMPLARTMDKLGPIARGVEDLAYVLSAIAGPDGLDPTCHDAPFVWPASLEGVRVGYDKLAFDAVSGLKDEAMKSIYTDALETCRGLFGELRPIELPRDSLLSGVTMATVEVESAESFAELTDAGRLGELVRQRENDWPNTFRRAGLFPAVDYLRAQRQRRRYNEQLRDATAGVDVYVTVPRVGPSLLLANLAGWPCVVGRGGMANGLPQQVEFVGKPYREASLLAVASAFEATVGSRQAWPERFGA